MKAVEPAGIEPALSLGDKPIERPVTGPAIGQLVVLKKAWQLVLPSLLSFGTPEVVGASLSDANLLPRRAM